MGVAKDKAVEKAAVLKEIEHVREELTAPSLGAAERHELRDALVRLYARYTNLLKK
jgi:hypothetical protein